MRARKLAGSLVLAVLALATAVPAATAAEFHAESAPVRYDGTQVGTDVLTVNAGTTKCNEVTYSGENAAQTSQSGSLKGTYSKCLVEPIGTAHVTTAECTYEVTIVEIKSVTDAHGELHVKCGAGNIKVVATALGVTKCTIQFPSQSVSLTLTTHGAGTTRDITIEGAVNGLKYTQTAGSGLGACKTETASNGKYTGTATASGTNSGGVAQGIWFE